MNALFFLSYIFAVLGQFSDARTTEFAITFKGFVEANPIGKFLLAHLGNGGTYAVKLGALPLLGILFLGLGHIQIAIGTEVFIGTLGFTLGILNFIKLRKAGATFGQVF